jgi:putative transposase
MGITTTPILKGIKVRLYPTVKQQVYLSKLFGCGRFVFNKCLDKAKQYYQENKSAVTLKVLGNYFHQELTKNEAYSFLNEHNTKVLKQECMNLLDSYKNFFVNGTGFPKYKAKRDDTQSIRFPAEAISNKTFTGNQRVNLTKQLKNLKFRCSDRDYHKLTQDFRTIKSFTISKQSDGCYYGSFLVPFIPEVKSNSNNVVGIDLGIKTLATLSDGLVYENKRYLLRRERKQKHLQRAFSRKQKGSKNRVKNRFLLARIHSKIRRQRNTYLHQMTSKVVNDNQVITIESLNVKGMLKNHCLAKHVSDVSISEIVRQFRYKTSWYGRTLIEVSPWFPSSKKCSKCDHIKKILTLTDRTYTCDNCGQIIDRDLNAAINIREEGLRILRETLPRQDACGGDVSLPDSKSLKAAPVKQERTYGRGNKRL